MPALLYFENEHTKKRYDVVSFDQTAGTVTLIGPHKKPFTEKFDKTRFQSMGYQLKQDTGVTPPPPPVAQVVPA